MSADCRAIFVYGTLMRGQQRESMWTKVPEQVLPACTRARLYDLGPFPAIVAGDDLVAGELRLFRHDDMRETLVVLDAIEGYRQGGEDLYVRRIVSCQQINGARFDAHAYFFANPDLLLDRPAIAPGPDGYCRWRNPIGNRRTTPNDL